MEGMDAGNIIVLEEYLQKILNSINLKCFSYKGAKLWNDPSTKVKTSKTYEVFKKRICNVSSEC